MRHEHSSKEGTSDNSQVDRLERPGLWVGDPLVEQMIQTGEWTKRVWFTQPDVIAELRPWGLTERGRPHGPAAALKVVYPADLCQPSRAPPSGREKKGLKIESSQRITPEQAPGRSCCRETVLARSSQERLGGHPKPARDGHRKTGQLT
jgi:hypothetical protein